MENLYPRRLAGLINRFERFNFRIKRRLFNACRAGIGGYLARGVCACFASKEGTVVPFDINSSAMEANGGHGGQGINLLFVDGHSQYARWQQLNYAPSSPTYNFDWTVNGLKGMDLQ